MHGVVVKKEGKKGGGGRGEKKGGSGIWESFFLLVPLFESTTTDCDTRGEKRKGEGKEKRGEKGGETIVFS